jgi:Mrp family chromosome partitioning ATPase/capsular polysaccharide biosynthesis protein
LTSFDSDPTLDRRAGVLQNEPDNPLRHYAGVLRRRARWIIIGTVIGLAIGSVASLFVKPHTVTTHYYKATNTLVVNGGAGVSQNSTYTLPMAAQLIQSQELQAKVGKKVHLSSVETSKLLAATVRSDQYALDVTGIATNAKKAELIANTAASLLNSAASAAAREQFTSDQSQLLQKKNKLLGERNDLQGQIAGDTNSPLQPQLDSLNNQLTALYGQIEQLGSEPPVLSLTTLQPAHAIEINKDGYDYRRSININTPGQIGPQQTDTTSSQALLHETNLAGPTQLSKSEVILIGGGVGLLLGLVAAFVIEAWDDRIRSRTRVEELCDLPVLAEIPNLTREQASTNSIAMLDSAKSPTAERYRATCTAVLFAMGETATERPDGLVPSGNGTNGSIDRPTGSRSGRAPVVLVTSPGPGEGKSTTSANLAAAFADTGRRVLVVDADFRRPALGRFLNPVPNLVDPDGPATTRVDGVAFLSSPRGIEAPGDVVFELRRLIDARQDDFDVIVVDTPPMLTTNDATDLLAAADAVVLVVRSGHTRTASAMRAATVLSRLRADVLGVVLNGCDRKDMDSYYAYGYYYGSDKKRKVWQRSATEDAEPEGAAHEARADGHEVPSSRR